MKSPLKYVLNKEARLQLRRLYYSGSRYYCNVCGHYVRTMFDAGYGFPILAELDVVGGETIANDVCPICFSSSRTRLLCEYLHKNGFFNDTASPRKMLHIAPEYGLLVRLKANKMVDYVGADLEPDKYDGIMSIVRCDITQIEYPDQSFDLIVCSHVLEHVPDDRLAMRELHRVLKPTGTAILQVPMSASLKQTVEDPTVTDPRERERRFGQYDHIRIYADDYVDRLRESGFKVEIVDPANAWGEARVQELRLNPREQVFVGRHNHNDPRPQYFPHTNF